MTTITLPNWLSIFLLTCWTIVSISTVLFVLLLILVALMDVVNWWKFYKAKRERR